MILATVDNDQEQKQETETVDSQKEDCKGVDNQEIAEESLYTTGSFEVIKDWNPDQDITHEDD